jgi:hypothetical protein
MTATERSTVVGVFRDRTHAEQAVDELRRLGFRDDQIGVAARSGDYAATVAEGEDTKWAAGATAGAVAGGATGTLLGVAVAAGLIPGIGPVIAGGMLAGVLASAATGVAAGGLLGALIGLGVPEEEASYYHGEFEAGRTIVTVRADGRFAEVRDVLRRFGAYDMHNRDTGTAVQTPATATTGAVHATATPTAGREFAAGHKSADFPVQRDEDEAERRRSAGEIHAGDEVRMPTTGAAGKVPPLP